MVSLCQTSGGDNDRPLGLPGAKPRAATLAGRRKRLSIFTLWTRFRQETGLDATRGF